MKASELRIGNTIASSGNPSNIDTWVIGNVVSISSLDTEFEQIEIETEEEFTWFFKDNYFGIPLTEEWLLNFGAERYEFDNGQLNQYRISNRLFVFRDGFWTDYGSSKSLRYVHQLQNLYFALTGEELEITTKTK